MDMMYMPDALDACIQIMEADPSKLVHRNSFNVTSMSFTPEMLYAEPVSYTHLSRWDRVRVRPAVG